MANASVLSAAAGFGPPVDGCRGHGAATNKHKPALEVPVLAAARLKELPVISQTAYRLLLMLAEREHNLHGLESLLETDPALTAKVLGVANSAAFHVSGARRCLTVREAVNRIGTVAAMEIAAQFALAGCFKTQPDARETVRALWMHALMVAWQAKELARVSTIAPEVNPEAAYAGGLLHDIGYVVMLSVAPGLAPTMRLAVKGGVANEDTLRVALQEDEFTNHEAFGHELLKHWGIPQPLPEALRHLHDPQRWPWANATALSMCHVLYAADLLVRNEQRLQPQPLPELMHAHAEEFEALRLNEEQLQNAGRAALRQAGAIRAMAETMAG